MVGSTARECTVAPDGPAVDSHLSADKLSGSGTTIGSGFGFGSGEGAVSGGGGASVGGKAVGADGEGAELGVAPGAIQPPRVENIIKTIIKDRAIITPSADFLSLIQTSLCLWPT
jgi:hypothetical protein